MNFRLFYYYLKQKLLFIFILCIIVFSAFYLYTTRVQVAYPTEHWSGGRCLSELTSLKYQLNVVTEYKDRIDKLLTETQQLHTADKRRFKDIMDSCIAMKQQVTICQSQFEDLQLQCKKVREDYDRVSKELEKLKYPDKP